MMVWGFGDLSDGITLPRPAMHGSVDAYRQADNLCG